VTEPPFPTVEPLGTSGLLVTFAGQLDDAANRAALAFRAALEAAHWPGLFETASSLTTVYIAFDPGTVGQADLTTRLNGLLAARDWLAADLPAGRRLWKIPTVYGGNTAPQLAEVAALAGMTPDQAVRQLSTARTRVMTIGFAPGLPYLGILSPEWDIPRQTDLTAQVPPGALVLAVRQMVLFPVASPTGWRHIGQTAFTGFRPDSDTPFPLRPGDEVMFPAATPAELDAPDGGATCEPIR